MSLGVIRKNLDGSAIVLTAILRASPLLIATFPVHVHRCQQNISRRRASPFGVLFYKRPRHTRNFRNASAVRDALVEPERCLCDGASKK